MFTVPFLYLLTAHVFSRFFSLKESICVSLSVSSIIIYGSFIHQDYYGVITKTEFKQTTELISNDKLHRPVFVMCGDKRWYDYYFNKFKIDNYTYVKNSKQLEELINKTSEAWILYAHCFVDLEMEDVLLRYPVIQSYKPQTLSFAALYRFKK